MQLHNNKQIAVDRTVKFFDSFLNEREHGQHTCSFYIPGFN